MTFERWSVACFVLILAGVEPVFAGRPVDTEAGLSGAATKSSRRIDFGRDAPSSLEAIRSAIADVIKTRFRVAHVESDFVNIIAKINSELAQTSSS